MKELKCAIKIMKKNKYIEIRKIGNKFYYYWIIESKVGNKILEKFKRYFDKNKKIIYIDTGRNNIKFTTISEIKKGIDEIFEDNKTEFRTPIHMNVHKYLNTEEAHKYLGSKITSEIYGHNDLGTLAEIKNIDKIEQNELKESKRRKEANELLDKLL